MDSREPASIHNTKAFTDPHFTDKGTKARRTQVLHVLAPLCIV